MTVITLTVPCPPDAHTLQRLARELNATDVQVREEAVAAEEVPVADFGAQFHWDEALELTKNVGGKPMSEIVIEDREDRF